MNNNPSDGVEFIIWQQQFLIGEELSHGNMMVGFATLFEPAMLMGAFYRSWRFCLNGMLCWVGRGWGVQFTNPRGIFISMRSYKLRKKYICHGE